MFCKLINKFGNFHVENKIFLNISKDYLFSFTKVCLLKNIFTNNIISVKKAKVYGNR